MAGYRHISVGNYKKLLDDSYYYTRTNGTTTFCCIVSCYCLLRSG